MSEIKIGIVGCGAAARKYYVPVIRTYPDISKSVFLADHNISQAKALAEELGSSNFTDDYRNIIPEVNGVIIAVPHFHHYMIAKDFLSNNIHVLCEKPLTEKASEALDLIATAKREKVALCVNNTRRMFPCYQLAKKSIDNNDIGKLLSIRYLEANVFSWESETGFYVDPRKSSKGVLLDLGAHVLDLICWFVGERPSILSYKDDSFGGPESLSHILAHTSTCHIDVKLNRLIDLDSYFIIQGEQGSIEIDLKQLNSIIIRDKNRKVQKRKSPRKMNVVMARPIIDNFFEVVRMNQSPLITGSDVISSIELIERCYNQRKRLEMPWYENLEELTNE